MSDSNLQTHPRPHEHGTLPEVTWSGFIASLLLSTYPVSSSQSLKTDPHPWLRGIYTCTPSALPLGIGQKDFQNEAPRFVVTDDQQLALTQKSRHILQHSILRDGSGLGGSGCHGDGLEASHLAWGRSYASMILWHSHEQSRANLIGGS